MPRLKQLAKAVVGEVLTTTLGDRNGRVTLTTRKGPAAGLRFQLDIKKRQEYAYWFGTYDLPILQQIAALVKPGWTAWDCGTYLGYYTCFFARLVGPAGKVYAFEPDPSNLALTQRNLTLNGLSNVTMIHAAIGEPCGEMELFLNDGTNSHLPGVYVGANRETYARTETREASLKVRCLSLDDAHFVEGAGRPNIIKIDIEGAEMLALPHTRRLCREVRPYFVLELHNPECDLAAWNWSREQGYSLTSIATGRILTRPEEVGGTLLCSPL
jgi:FkbM family methyltransferase